MGKFLLISIIVGLTVTAVLSIGPKNTHAAVGCAFGPANVRAGDPNALGVITSDMPGSVTITMRTFGGPIITLGSVSGGTGLGAGGGSVTIPTTTTATAYQIYANNGFGSITCADPSGTIGGNLTVSAAPGGEGCSGADVNNDETINVTDSQLIAAAVGGTYNPNFDLNGDGSVTSADVNFAFDCATGINEGEVECSNFLNCIREEGSTFVRPGTYTGAGFLGTLITSILPIAIVLGGFLSVIIIVISGIQFITSSGNPEAAAGARSRLTYALIGFVLLVLAYGITAVIDNVFLKGSGIFGP